jgi:RNA polymerase sigma-70 factor (ECF subfamily)
MVGINDAADVLQQVFLQTFRTIDQFHYQSRFGTWLYRLTVNECLQFLRTSRRAKVISLDHEPMDEAPNHARKMEQREVIERAVARLEPELRAIFLLREVEELSYAEIAASLRIPEGTVGSRLNRARRQLKNLLEEMGWNS